MHPQAYDEHYDVHDDEDEIRRNIEDAVKAANVGDEEEMPFTEDETGGARACMGVQSPRSRAWPSQGSPRSMRIAYGGMHADHGKVQGCQLSHALRLAV